MIVLLKRLPLLVVFCLMATVGLHAQDNAGLTGVVTDASGAVVTRATVVLKNPSRGLSFTVTTNNEGAYRFPNVPPAPGYQATFTHAGFSTEIVTELELTVGITTTQNAKLVAGTTDSTSVTAQNASATINTTDATIGNNFDITLIDDLPVQARNSPAALFVLQPGVTSAGSVTGSRTDQTSVTVDGMDANDISTGQFGNVNGGMPVDATQEFRGTVAGLTSNQGTGSGGQFQLVTKSGTNKFHGDLNEYHRDTVTTSNSWFNNNATPSVPRTKYIQNQFGGAIGGPIFKDKAFFFFDFNNSRIVQAITGVDTVPLDSYKAGTINYVKTGCAASTRVATAVAGCVGSYSAAQVKALDPAGIGDSASLYALFNSRYPTVNDISGGDGLNTGSFRFTQGTLYVLYQGVGRLDYNLTSKQRVFLQYHDSHRDSVQSVNRFAGDPLTRPFTDRSYGYVGSHIWQIGTNKVNQFYYGSNTTVFSFPLAYNGSIDPTTNPTGANYIGSLSGIITTPYDANNIQRRRVPIPEFRDDFNWNLGTHSLSAGGTFKFIKASNFLGTDYNSYTIGLGGNVTTLNNTLRPADLQSTGTTNTTQWDNAFALALGRVGRIGSIYNFNNAGVAQPQGTGSNRRFRYYQTEAYVGDTWKARKNLTISYGVRYQFYSVPYEATGAESVVNLGFDDYFNARLKQTAAGASGNSSLPFLSYSLGGPVNNAAGYYKPSYKDFAPRVALVFNPTSLPHTVFNVSANVVYDRTLQNAINFFQNQNSFLFQNNTSQNFGSAVDPATSLKTDPRLGATIFTLPAPPTVAAPVGPYTPYVTAAGVPTGLASGSNSTTNVDPNLKDPYSIAYNGGLQQEFPHGFILRANYAGRLGRRLLGQVDAGQLIDYVDPASGQSLSSAFAAVTTYLRNNPTANGLNVPSQAFFTNQVTPGYGASHGYGNNTALVAYAFRSNATLGDITDVLQALASNNLLPANVGLASQFAVNRYFTNKGFSSYNGLLLTVSKNMGYGVKFDFNYTWQHSVDNVSLIANASANGTGYICDVTRPRACRGNSDFDVKHVITADLVAELPFGQGRRYASSVPWYVNEAIGGWAFSAIPSWQSGAAYTTSTNAYFAGFANNDPAIFDNLNGDDLKIHKHKNAANQLVAYKDPVKALSHFRGPIGIEYGSRNNLRGPSQFNLDAGLSKAFEILPDNRLRLRFRADAFNVLNHPSFSTPTANITSASFGVIGSATSNIRVGQFSLRLEF